MRDRASPRQLSLNTMARTLRSSDDKLPMRNLIVLELCNPRWSYDCLRNHECDLEYLSKYNETVALHPPEFISERTFSWT